LAWHASRGALCIGAFGKKILLLIPFFNFSSFNKGAPLSGSIPGRLLLRRPGDFCTPPPRIPWNSVHFLVPGPFGSGILSPANGGLLFPNCPLKKNFFFFLMGFSLSPSGGLMSLFTAAVRGSWLGRWWVLVLAAMLHTSSAASPPFF